MAHDSMQKSSAEQPRAKQSRDSRADNNNMDGRRVPATVQRPVIYEAILIAWEENQSFAHLGLYLYHRLQRAEQDRSMRIKEKEGGGEGRDEM